MLWPFSQLNLRHINIRAAPHTSVAAVSIKMTCGGAGLITGPCMRNSLSLCFHCLMSEFFFFNVFVLVFLSPQNNTSWRPQSCQECTCYGDVAICRPAHCPNPKCDFQRVRRHFFFSAKPDASVSQCFHTTFTSLCVLIHMEDTERFHHTSRFVFLFCHCFSRTLCNLL